MSGFKVSMLLACVGLAGCGSFSGLDESSKGFTCKAPAGIGCTSVSGVYANAVANNLPGSPKPAEAARTTEMPRDIVGSAPATGMPVLSAPVVIRIWVAPWEDENHLLHDQAFLYTVADPGHWQIAHTKERILNKYMPVIAPKANTKGIAVPEGQNRLNATGTPSTLAMPPTAGNAVRPE